MSVTPPSAIGGSVLLPSSKSISNRVLVMNALAEGGCGMPENVSDCDDTRVMLEWLDKRPAVVDIGAAGTAMRFSTALLAVTDGEHVITGCERMRHRPIGVLVDALRSLGASVEYVGETGFPPLRIVGNASLEGGTVSLPGNISSQYISALLMVAPALARGLVLRLTGEIVSRPYIDLTLRLMADYGADVAWVDSRSIRVAPRMYRPRPFFVESDWSAASYWYEIVALCGMDAQIVLPGLYKDSYQGDAKVAEFFGRLGVRTDYGEHGRFDGFSSDIPYVRLTNMGNACERLDCDLVNQPDLAQTLVVTCCMMGVPFRFTGLQSLKIKETDRIEALCRELGKLGLAIGQERGSVLYWNGERTDAGSDVAIDTYEDHRMAMAFAPCALALGEIKINNPGVVSKSYPKFWSDLRAQGFGLTPQP